ncbi:hypothetical protein EKO04_009697 [Ascochyta lentis]|uniref:Oligopeptide transporter n=1 Tax=Ascochyta lentis TaxID=205686 RepID=A0A8H7IWH9_9PLEO|nr:hypothetical protein EKO04_009697 [Ascochyta lentis]
MEVSGEKGHARPVPSVHAIASQGREATEDEIQDLPHIIGKIPFEAWVAALLGAAERFDYYSTVITWQNYMQNERGVPAVPGALGLGQSTATAISNVFFIFQFLSPLLFAFLSDIRIGRYNTLLLGLCLSLCGNLVMLTTSLPVALDHGAGFPGLIAAMVLIALGVGAIKATISPFIGDQLPKAKPRIVCQKDGTLAVEDAARTLQLLYNAFYCFSFSLFYLAITQMQNNLISQAGQMNLHGVPNDMIQAMAGVACIIFGPIIQSLYNFLAKRRIAFGPIKRIAVAFLICSGAMAYASGLQKLVYVTGPCYNAPLVCPASDNGRIPNDINVWTQLPVYVALAVAEIFGLVTASQFSYSHAPKDMRSVVQAMVQLSACLGSVLGIAISPAARDPWLVIVYASIAGALAVCSILFWCIFRKHDAEENVVIQ